MTKDQRDDDRDASFESDDYRQLDQQLAAAESEEMTESSPVDREARIDAADLHQDDEREATPEEIAAWTSFDPSQAYAGVPAQRIGRRGFLVGVAAAGVPLAGLARIMERGGDGGVSQVNAPAFQQSTPVASATSEVATPAASPAVEEATPVAPEATPVESDPFGQLTVIRNQTPQYTESPVASDTLRVMLTLNRNADFSPVSYSQDFQIMASYLDPLVWINERTMEPMPGLAEYWEIDDEKRRIIFTLREGVTWHDGRPLTQQDVVFSLLAYRDDINSAVRNFFVYVSDVKAVGTRSIAVEMSSPDANFIPNGGSQFIFPSHLLQEHWESRPIGQRSISGFDWEAEPPVGTGPWMYASGSDSSMTFERNPDYWAGDPANFEQLVFTWDTDPRTRSEAWRNGEVDLLFPVRVHELELVSTQPGLLFACDSPVVMFAQFNLNNPARSNPTLLSDIRIRQALSLMTDRRSYAQNIFLGFIDHQAAGTFPQPWLRNNDLTNPTVSRRSARELLNEAGFSRQASGTTVDQNGEPLSLNVITRIDARYEMRATLRALADDFAELGVTLRVEELGDAAFNERWIRGHDFDLIAFSYQTYPGFTDFDLYGSNWDIRINPQGWNPGGYNNGEADTAIREALNARSLDSLVESVSELQVIANDDLFGLWLGFPQDLVLTQPDLLGFEPVMHWQTWHTRKLWRRPTGAQVPDVVVQ